MTPQIQREDNELEVTSHIYQALKSLPQDARDRVITYLFGRFESEREPSDAPKKVRKIRKAA